MNYSRYFCELFMLFAQKTQFMVCPTREVRMLDRRTWERFDPVHIGVGYGWSWRHDPLGVKLVDAWIRTTFNFIIRLYLIFNI
jgi:hypothetical protein